MAAHAIARTATDEVEVYVRALPPVCTAVAGRVKNLSNGAIDLDLPSLVPPESKVNVEFAPGCSVEGEVTFCNRETSGYRVRVHFKPHVAINADLRSEPRFQTDGESATISVLFGGEGIGLCHATVQDVSRSGLGMLSDSYIPPDAWVKVELGSAIVFGEIRHCTSNRGGNYQVGMITETVILRRTGIDAADSAPAEHAEEPPARGLMYFLKKLKKDQAPV